MIKKQFGFISSLLILLVYGILSILAFSRFEGPFSPSRNWLSDLGSQTLNPSGWFFYNLGIVLTGILLFFFFWSLSVWKQHGNRKQNFMLSLAGITGSLGGIGMILSAVFPIELPELHSFFSAALYILIGSGFVFLAVGLLYYPKFPRWMAVLGFLIALEDMLWSVLFNTCIIEFVTVGCFLLYILLLGMHTRLKEKFI